MNETQPVAGSELPTIEFANDPLGFYLFGVALLAIVIGLCALAPATLGLWDESYYISWIDAPRAYDALIQPFGLFFHPFYILLGRSLIAIRILGVLLLVATGVVMGREIQRYFTTVLPEVQLGHLPLVGGMGALLYYVLWILTPSYNLLANAGGALVLAGAFGWAAIDRGAQTSDWPRSLYCGIGGALAFLGKPTFSVLAGALVLLQLVLLARRNAPAAFRRAVVTGIAAALLIVVMILAAMPLGVFVLRVRAGVAAFGAEYSTIALLRETLGSILRAPWYLFASIALTLVSGAVAATGRIVNRRVVAILVVASAILLVFNAAMVARLLRSGLLYSVDPWSIPIATPVVALSIVMLALGLALRPSVIRATGPVVALLVLTATPYLVAFGTANDLLRQAGMSLFPILVAATLCARLCFPKWLARAAEASWIVLVVVLLGWSALVPYNQPSSVFTATVPTAVPFSTTVLRLDPATAHYARDLRILGRSADITPDTPMLDLSGVAPGTVALLGARAPFFPWIIHFSKRPSVLAAATWKSLSAEDRRRTWIIGPIHPRFAEHPAIAEIARSGRYRRVAVLRYAPAPDHPPVAFWAPIGR